MMNAPLRLLAALLLAGLLCTLTAQQEAAEDEEQDHLRQVLAEAGNAPPDFIRAIETHLAKFPGTTRKEELERALVKAAIEVKDNRRLVLYGEKVLAREPDDILVLDRVCRALLYGEDKESNEKALKYARHFEKVVREFEVKERADREGGGGVRPSQRAEFREAIEHRLNKALVYQARATGNLGKLEEAAALARRSFESYPTAEAAREIGRWLERLGKEREAIMHYAEAFAIPDDQATGEQRAKDRARIGELYRKLNASEKGLGDIVLDAYDRTAALVASRHEALKAFDPNASLTDPLEFTLSGLNGDSLKLSSLRGKVVVLDFWATWCGPCRTQYPLYEEVKERFKDRDEVVFLAINTDERRETVAPFLEKNQWGKKVYFEDGLSAALKVSSIPTTIVFDKSGKVASRMNGFIPERFVDMLTERIESCLQ